MANVYAFKHVELYNVGSGKKRVLRPPGGGTSDIFGGDPMTTPRSMKNHMKSNIFAEPSPIKSQAGDARRPQTDSYNRLFGETERPLTAAKSKLSSNIPIGGDAPDSSLKDSNGNAHEHNGNRSEKNGNSMNGEISKPYGNFENVQQPVINKNRIPPGGFSSGLW